MSSIDVINTVPNDMWNEIFGYLNGESLFALSHVCQLLRNLINIRKTSITAENFGALCSRGDIVSLFHHDYTLEEINKGLYIASLRGHYKLTVFFINKGATNINKAFVNACEFGDKQIIDLLLRKGATNYKGGFDRACKAGHLHVARLMVDLGCKYYLTGFSNACKNGHTELAIFCFNPDTYNDELVEEWRQGKDVKFSVIYQHRDLFYTLSTSCRKGHIEIMRLFKSLFLRFGKYFFYHPHGITICPHCQLQLDQH